MPDQAPSESLAGWRERASDPLRRRLAEALARRAPAHAGAARTVIEARLAALVQAPADAGAGTPALAPGHAMPAAGATSASPGPLAALVAHAARLKPQPVLAGEARPREAAAAPRAPVAPVAPAAAGERTLQFFKRTWSRLSAEQRLAQSRASLPDNAGPLNSHHLVHRALTLMQSLSPAYLEHFVGYVDALQWLEQANEAAAADPRAAAPRRSAPLRR